MRIRAVSIFTADLPLAQPFEHASSGRIERLEEVVVRIEAASGEVGWAEVRGNAPYVTGESPGRVVAALAEILVPRLIAQPETSPAALGRFLDAVVPGSSTAKAALDTALHDAWARGMGLPLARLLGAGAVRAVKVHATLPFCAPEEAARRASAYLDRGVRLIKLRVGLRPFDRDLARIEAVAEAVARHPAGAEARLATDANQGWSAKEAIRALRRLEAFDLAWAEQPVAAQDLAGLRDVRESATVPVVADESCGTAEDLLRIIELRAADAVHLKLVKAGGVRKLMAMTATAEAAGLPYLLGQMDEGTLATAAALHCAAAAAPLSCELWGFQRVGSQPFSALHMQDGQVALPEGPGLGIAVEESALRLVHRFGTAA
jgi:L-alanine-DL-glutamate epimerase-like enolase superfamily enzyme